MTLRPLLLSCLAVAPAISQAQYVHDALQAGDLICEFRDGYRRDLVADLKPQRPPADLMLVFESIRMGGEPQAADAASAASVRAQAAAGTASAYSSRTPGKRPAVVRATPNAVHFIQPVGPSVRVTTLSSCEQWRWKRGVETCVRFSARHAWHFDRFAQRIPDTSFARQPSGAASGSCEAWNLD